MEIPVPVCSGGTDMKKDEGFSVEVESRYEGWWRYNVTILCGCFDADGDRIGFASAESVVAPVGSDLSAPPEGAAAERRIGIRSIACDHIVMYVYIVPHTLPETREIGDYRVIALPSHHSPGTETLLYIVQHGGKTVFWVHDSGLLREDTIAYLRKSDFHFDAVSMDCTLARGSNFTSAHMDVLQCRETADLLRDMGRIDERTVLLLSHIGHLIDRTHDELSREAAELGFIVAYDTMTLDI